MVMDTLPWHPWVDETLERRRAAEQLRTLKPLSLGVQAHATHVYWHGRPLVLFSGNDYLGLSAHPEVRRAVADAAQAHGQGPRGSALVCGHTALHAALEEELAALKGTACALLCPTGYAANMAVLTALCAPGVAVFSDALNHASIIDGVRLVKRSGCPVEVYRHSDMDHLAEQMERSDAPRKLIVTDGVFSMDGDVAPLRALVDLKRRHHALLVVDEAHSTLLFGPRGAGVAAAAGVEEEVDVHVGTLSKAFGGQGGFVATRRSLRDCILNRGRSFIYSTTLPVPVVAGVRAALQVATRDASLRQRVWHHVQTVTKGLAGVFELTPSSPILPLVVGDEARALAMAHGLLERGFHVTAIRPPTVPEGTARLRVALSAAHTPSEVEGLVAAIRALA